MGTQESIQSSVTVGEMSSRRGHSSEKTLAPGKTEIVMDELADMVHDSTFPFKTSGLSFLGQRK